MTTTPLKAPFPYFGGKRAAAPLIWDLLWASPSCIQAQGTLL